MEDQDRCAAVLHFAGMVCLRGQQGRFEKGSTFWAGVLSVEGFMDHEVGNCGTALCHIPPPVHPAVMALHKEIQRGVLEMVARDYAGYFIRCRCVTYIQ
jgi:hypothetical protein